MDIIFQQLFDAFCFPYDPERHGQRNAGLSERLPAGGAADGSLSGRPG